MRAPAAVYAIVIAAAFGLSTGITYLVDRNNNTLAGGLDAAFVVLGLAGLELWARRRRIANDSVRTMTFLFTDIEGSTRLLKETGAGYRDILDRHSAILRGAFVAHGGHEVDSQGDSFFAAFPSAHAAVSAAVEAQRTLAAEPAGGRRPVRVRMGIHTGAAEAAGDRYVGMTVHQAARIGAAAHGGQILASGATRSIIEAEDRDPGFGFRDLGRHRLKDLERPLALHQVVALGLEENFPPPRADTGGEPSRLGPSR